MTNKHPSKNSTACTEGTRTARSSSNTNRRVFLKAAGTTGAIGLTSLAGCIGGGGGGTGSGPLKFGGIYLLSGFASVYGQSAKRGIKMAVDEINKEGGIAGREIGEVLFRDSESSPSTAIDHARSLVREDNVDGLIGLDSSGVALQVAPVMKQLKKPLMITHASTPFVTTHEGSKAKGNKYVFRDGTNIAQQTFGAATVAADLDAKTWTTIGPDYAFGHQIWQYFKAFTKGMNLDLTYLNNAAVFPQLGSSDFTAQINKLINADPDAVVTGLWGGDLITFLNQAKNSRFFDVVDELLMNVGAATDVLIPMGKAMPNGLRAGTRYWFRKPDTEANNTFVNSFTKRYDGRYPSYNAQNAYTGIYLYKQAIEAADSAATEDIISEWNGIQTTAPVGTFTINEQSNQAILPPVWGTTKYSKKYGISILDPVQRIDAPSKKLRSLLKGSGLPAGV
jgi:branched-chain amino acid transport system substrate-binding protein